MPASITSPEPTRSAATNWETLIAYRDGPAALSSGRRADANLPGPIDVRLDCTITQRRVRTKLRGARQFLNHPPSAG